MLADWQIQNYQNATRFPIAGGAPRPLIEPWDPEMLQPNSVDVRLSHEFLVPNQATTYIDTAEVPAGHMRAVEADSISLNPGAFVLGSTIECFRLPDDLVGRVEGKSSLGRLGLVVHVTAGFIDAGFEGNVTLELVNHAPWAITLHGGMTIAQMAFSRCEPVRRPYMGRYQGQTGPQESRYAGAKRAEA